MDIILRYIVTGLDLHTYFANVMMLDKIIRNEALNGIVRFLKNIEQFLLTGTYFGKRWIMRSLASCRLQKNCWSFKKKRLTVSGKNEYTIRCMERKRR